ncbi:hypothetical protein CB0940_04754, partial [Cercospora beticola]
VTRRKDSCELFLHHTVWFWRLALDANDKYFFPLSCPSSSSPTTTQNKQSQLTPASTSTSTPQSPKHNPPTPSRCSSSTSSLSSQPSSSPKKRQPPAQSTQQHLLSATSLVLLPAWRLRSPNLSPPTPAQAHRQAHLQRQSRALSSPSSPAPRLRSKAFNQRSQAPPRASLKKPLEPHQAPSLARPVLTRPLLQCSPPVSWPCLLLCRDIVQNTSLQPHMHHRPTSHYVALTSEGTTDGMISRTEEEIVSVNGVTGHNTSKIPHEWTVE